MKVLITGGNQGIGFGIARRMMESKKCQDIFISSRSLENAELSAKKLDESLKNVHPLLLDYSKPETVENMLQELKSAKVKLNLLFLNAGVMYKGKGVSKPNFIDTIQTNYYQTIALYHKFCDFGLLEKKARVIFTSSKLGDLKRVKKSELKQELSKYKSNLSIQRLEEIVKIF